VGRKEGAASFHREVMESLSPLKFLLWLFKVLGFISRDKL
jgi:hypothetical protein